MGEIEGVSYVMFQGEHLEDYVHLARDLKEEAVRDTATLNPFVIALRQHRQDLQNADAAWRSVPTREQLLATEQNGLSSLTLTAAPVWDDIAEESVFPREMTGVRCCAG